MCVGVRFDMSRRDLVTKRGGQMASETKKNSGSGNGLTVLVPFFRTTCVPELN